MATRITSSLKYTNTIQQVKVPSETTVLPTLEPGDVWVADNEGMIIILIVPASDLLDRYNDHSITNECVKMLKITPRSHVIIDIGFDPVSLLDHIAAPLRSIQELGIIVTIASDLSKTIQSIITAKRTPRIVQPQRIIDPNSNKLSLLMSIPGVGEKTARAVLKESANSLAQALMALTIDDVEIDGVRLPDAHKTRKFFDVHDDCIIGPICQSDPDDTPDPHSHMNEDT